MAIYYLCSGFGTEHCFVNKFGELLSADLKFRNKLVVIPCTDNYEELNSHIDFFSDQLAEIDIEFEETILLTDDMFSEEMNNHIKTADMIYLTGGYPFIQRNFIFDNRLSKSLLDFSGVMLGISAGAMNMSKRIIMVTDGINSDETRVENGLGVVDFSVFPHCAFSGDEFAKTFHIGDDTVVSEKLLEASQGKEPVYFLQNKNEKNELKISFIRTANGETHFLSIYDGKIWTATANGFEIVDTYI